MTDFGMQLGDLLVERPTHEWMLHTRQGLLLVVPPVPKGLGLQC